MLCLLSTFFGFDLLPTGKHLGAVTCRNISKNMRVAAFKLIAYRSANIIKVEAPFFLSHLGVKHHLEQQIPQLSTQVVEVFSRNRVQHFISFFEGIRSNSGECLLFVPRTAVLRVPQDAQDLQQLFCRVRGLGLQYGRPDKATSGNIAMPDGNANASYQAYKVIRPT